MTNEELDKELDEARAYRDFREWEAAEARSKELEARVAELEAALWDIAEAEEHDGDASVCDFQTLQSIARAAIAKATDQTT